MVDWRGVMSESKGGAMRREGIAFLCGGGVDAKWMHRALGYFLPNVTLRLGEVMQVTGE